ncbi:protein spinster homolog 3-like isoform X2 [Tympanuchus pallidicinctus]|uniref:protein spinster homolog 3-like isoform X2 n=1 Tax=Tympanuchus pallidicinctus TaxID=109042 RepID=UPI0022872B21|nr:protein spinster homolog 3-like isoform X2 [Tympanuchus pallidicinctus]
MRWLFALGSMQNPSAHENTDLQPRVPHEEQNYGATAARVRRGPQVPVSRNRPAKRDYLIVGVLCYANLINFMDWFIVPGILLDIQKYFELGDGAAGLLQTVFILCYMLAAPFFGYLGDRYNRKVILGAGIFFWSAVTLGTSFISESHCWIFFLSRGLVGIGTASYSTVAPTIIADRFDEGKRTTMLSVFYICIPVGSGLGYILASSMARVTGDWHWAFRVTPCMGGLALVLLILLVPSRIQRRTEAHRALSIHGSLRVAAEKPGAQGAAKTSWCQDVTSLGKNWSFVWSSLGLTAMAFVTGALGLWVPMFLYRAQVALGIVQQCLEKSCDSSNSLIFGGITIGTGILGVIAGAEAARRLRKTSSRADPLICATSMFVSSLCLYIAIMVAQKNILSTFYVVTPRRQSTAIALQILASHLLGDAGSPYLIGMVSNAIQAKKDQSFQWSFCSLQYSFIICVFVGVFGGFFFLLTSFYIEEDRKEAEQL